MRQLKYTVIINFKLGIPGSIAGVPFFYLMFYNSRMSENNILTLQVCATHKLEPLAAPKIQSQQGKI